MKVYKQIEAPPLSTDVTYMNLSIKMLSFAVTSASSSRSLTLFLYEMKRS